MSLMWNIDLKTLHSTSYLLSIYSISTLYLLCIYSISIVYLKCRYSNIYSVSNPYLHYIYSMFTILYLLCICYISTLYLLTGDHSPRTQTPAHSVLWQGWLSLGRAPPHQLSATTLRRSRIHCTRRVRRPGTHGFKDLC